VNTTSHIWVPETSTESCWFCISWDHPFQRVVTRRRLKAVITVENITRTTSVKSCCEGFTKDLETGSGCVPLCEECQHGTCTAPFTCQCLPGYTGLGCKEVGCPRGTWGEDCHHQCTCSHGGLCTQVDGSCLCQPGWAGSECQAKCSPGTFGADCNSSCVACEAGHLCHHITGDCLKCDNNTWGESCSQTCQCQDPGMALCSHIDGRCFCEANYFGQNCQLHCPFGFSEERGECLTAGRSEGCVCPSDLFECDDTLGCVFLQEWTVVSRAAGRF